MRVKIPAMISIILAISILSLSCKSSQTTITSTTPIPTSYTLYELKYKLLTAYPDYFWCDPDFYPVAHEGVEQLNAIDQFPAITANQEEFSAISNQLNLPNKTSYNDDEKLQIYREYKKLNGVVQVVLATSGYTFTIRTGQNQGKTYQGTISTSGVIKVTSETSSINTCPICLAVGTLIDSPRGPIPVEELRIGMVVYTVDSDGTKVTGVISKTASVSAPSSFKITDIVLNDGRSVSASPGHPTADGRAISDLKLGDTLDGGTVVSMTFTLYSGFTFDILPDGGTGFYWANEILLKSTLAQ